MTIPGNANRTTLNEIEVIRLPQNHGSYMWSNAGSTWKTMATFGIFGSTKKYSAQLTHYIQSTNDIKLSTSEQKKSRPPNAICQVDKLTTACPIVQFSTQKTNIFHSRKRFIMHDSFAWLTDDHWKPLPLASPQPHQNHMRISQSSESLVPWLVMRFWSLKKTSPSQVIPLKRKMNQAPWLLPGLFLGFLLFFIFIKRLMLSCFFGRFAAWKFDQKNSK